MNRSAVINAIMFQVGWWGCIFLSSPFNVLLLMTLIAGHLSWVSRQPFKEVGFMLAVGVIGTTTDSLLMHVGVIKFPNNSFIQSYNTWFCPLWLSLLWVLFASTINHSLHFLSQHKLWAAIGGGVGAALSYMAGHEFERFHLNTINIGFMENIPGFVLIGAIWAILLPIFFISNQSFFQQYNTKLNSRN